MVVRYCTACVVLCLKVWWLSRYLWILNFHFDHFTSYWGDLSSRDCGPCAHVCHILIHLGIAELEMSGRCSSFQRHCGESWHAKACTLLPGVNDSEAIWRGANYWDLSKETLHGSSVFFLALYAYGRQIEKYAGTMVNGGLLIVLSLRRCDCRCGAALSGVSTIWLCQHDMTFWYVRSTLKSWSNFCSRDLNAVVLKDSLTFSFVRLGPLALGWFRRTPGSPRSFINLVPSLEYGTQKWRCFPVLHCWSISDPLTS